MKKLDTKQHRAMELKYFGKTYKEISTEIGVSADTIGGWFENNGSLNQKYQDFVKRIEERRLDELERVIEKDVNIATLMTNIIRSYGISLAGGKENPTARDVVEAWKVLRALKGLPTQVSKFQLEQKTELTEEDKELLKKAIQYAIPRENLSGPKIPKTTGGK